MLMRVWAISLLTSCFCLQAECIRSTDLENKVLPIGGPGEAMSALQQGTMLFDILGMEPKFVKVPIEVMDTVIKVLDGFAGFFANMR